MMIRKIALCSVLMFHAAPALADPQLAEPPRTPKKITSIDVRETAVEFVAVTRRAQANTEFHRRYIDESLALNKAYPGYPKPAYVSFDLRVQF